MSEVRTLVVHTGGIGDLILAFPALTCLAEEGPLELLGRTDRLALVVAAEIARKAHDMDDVRFETVFGEPAEPLRALLARFDRSIVWMRDDGAIVGAVRGCGVRDVRAFPGLPPENWSTHASRYYLECLGYSPVPPIRLDFAPAGPSLDVVVHPGSGGHAKNWPLERFLAVVDALKRAGRTVTWCVGPAEEDMRLPRGAATLRTSSLVDLARKLAGARLYVGNDSGITHLAAAVGCPTIAIFGPTEPRVWAPLGEHVTVVRGGPWPDVETVLGCVPLRK